MSEAIRFYHRGAIRSVSDVAPTQTILQYLREDLHCTGSKEGCAEGDCGACTVVIGELQAGELVLKSVNACIQFMPTLDGRALFTVEDLKQADGSLHPVQQAMVDCHGSQCGFCTPGFVMSLWSLYLQREGRSGPAGAARHRHCAVRQPVPLHRLPADHRCRAAHGPAAAGPPRPRGGGGCAARRCSATTRFHTATMARPSSRRARWRSWSPRARRYPDARMLAGATDIGLWVTKQLRELDQLIYIGQVAELQAVSRAGRPVAHRRRRHAQRRVCGAVQTLPE